MPTCRILVSATTPVQATTEPYAVTAMLSVVVEGPHVVRMFDHVSEGPPMLAEVLDGVPITSASTFQLQDLAGRRPDFLWFVVDDADPAATAYVSVAW